MEEVNKRSCRGRRYKSEFERNKNNQSYLDYYGREGSEDDDDFEANSQDLEFDDEFDSDFDGVSDSELEVKTNKQKNGNNKEKQIKKQKKQKIVKIINMDDLSIGKACSEGQAKIQNQHQLKFQTSEQDQGKSIEVHQTSQISTRARALKIINKNQIDSKLISLIFPLSEQEQKTYNNATKIRKKIIKVEKKQRSNNGIKDKLIFKGQISSRISNTNPYEYRQSSKQKNWQVNVNQELRNQAQDVN